MDLFGRQGYRATTIAQIEQAAGLTGGAGGLYRHFTSKRELLEAGLDRQVAAGPDLVDFLQPGDVDAETTLHQRLLAIARAGLRRLESERDLNRMLLRDLADHPDLLARVRDTELRRVHAALTGWLQTQTHDPAVDVPALAAVLMSAVSHYWIMTDIFDGLGEHPLQISEDRFLTALADTAARVLAPG